MVFIAAPRSAAGAERGQVAAACAGNFVGFDIDREQRSVLPSTPKLTASDFAALGENGVAQKGVFGPFVVERAEEDDGGRLVCWVSWSRL